MLCFLEICFNNDAVIYSYYMLTNYWMNYKLKRIWCKVRCLL